ncbi:MAG: 50S ribosome-binding GTPase [Phycisphaerae bacterium]|nr:50S ribosome-binding GTPase [Phycisphaerae bacterium]
MFRTDDTITAISTAGGSAPRGIVRLSGNDAVPIAAKIFRPATGSLTDAPGFSCCDGILSLLTAGGDLELPGKVYVFRSPRSYTRQDVVELHIPGSASLCSELVSVLIDAGARLAEPGEFTARAFLSGRIDLSAAEGVADISNSDDDAQLRAGMAALGGKLHNLCSTTAIRVTEVLAAIEASIDFADEDITICSVPDATDELQSVAQLLAETTEQSIELPDTSETPTVVIAGNANVGKSSLLNALTGTNRAITSGLAGTTRDVLRGSLLLPCGSVVTLLDVAGFAPAKNAIESEANIAAHNAIAQADMILLVIDPGDDDTSAAGELRASVRSTNPSAPLMVIVNKCDACDDDAAARAAESLQLSPDAKVKIIRTSAVTGAGLDELKQLLTETLHLRTVRSGFGIGLHARQRRCLLGAIAAIQQARDMLLQCESVTDSAEFVAVELRESLAQLGAISGEVVTEDILGRIFARFCVGK